MKSGKILMTLVITGIAFIVIGSTGWALVSIPDEKKVWIPEEYKGPKPPVREATPVLAADISGNKTMLKPAREIPGDFVTAEAKILEVKAVSKGVEVKILNDELGDVVESLAMNAETKEESSTIIIYRTKDYAYRASDPVTTPFDKIATNPRDARLTAITQTRVIPGSPVSDRGLREATMIRVKLEGFEPGSNKQFVTISTYKVNVDVNGTVLLESIPRGRGPKFTLNIQGLDRESVERSPDVYNIIDTEQDLADGTKISIVTYYFKVGEGRYIALSYWDKKADNASDPHLSDDPLFKITLFEPLQLQSALDSGSPIRSYPYYKYKPTVLLQADAILYPVDGNLIPAD